MQTLSVPDSDSAPNPAGSVFNNLPKMFLKINFFKNRTAIKTKTTDNEVKSLFSVRRCQQILEFQQRTAAPRGLMKNW